jgi:NAD(P)-dependent dehydrogenase (short-subunit alcohol dehydrogenase family)
MTTTTTNSNHRAVVVTGASRGLGAAITGRLAADGYTVFAASRHPLPPSGPGIVPLTLDVIDHRSIHAAATVVAERLDGQGLHALINNAAVLEAGPLEYLDPDTVARHLDTNVAGPITTVQAFLPQLRAGQGRIVNISSINASLPMPYWGLYCATKAALAALTDSLRLELAPSGVVVSLLTLGAFATDIRRNALASWPTGGRYTEARAAMEALVGMLDATATDPTVLTEAVAELLASPQPAAHVAVGDGIEDLVALAAQPAEVRDATIAQLLGAAPSAALRSDQ